MGKVGGGVRRRERGRARVGGRGDSGRENERGELASERGE